MSDLLGALAGQRAHVLGIVEGPTADQLAQPVLPSGWSCGGLLHHLAVDVERFWFRRIVAAQPELDWPDGWTVPAGVDPVALYRDEVARADLVLGGIRSDAPLAGWVDGQFGDYVLHDVGEVVLHVVVETANHAGHLDAARELIDGRQWLVLD